jgi:hypothetical protein
VKNWHRSTALSVGSLVVVAVMLLSAAPAMGASASTPHGGERTPGSPHPQLINPVGTYTMYSANGAAGDLTVESDHDFSLSSSGTDTGYWVLEGKYFAFVVTAEDGTTDIGCTFLGKVVSGVGINSGSNPGPYDCTGYSNTWYATLVSLGRAHLSKGHWSSSQGFNLESSKVATTSAPSGNYVVHLSDTAKGALTIDTGGTFSLDYAHGGPTDSGYWVSLGKSYAQVTTSSNSTEDLDCLLLGEVSAMTGDIGSRSAQGPFVCGDGQTGTWYAIKKV